jgi:CHAD domain-containing protein
MPYEFQQDEAVAEGIKRIVAEQIEDALRELSATSSDRAKAVHNTRKGLKKIRAVLRLVGDELGRKVYAAENRCFRDAGRSLSDVRDAEVLIEAFDNLAEHFTDRIAPRAATAARKALLKRRDEATEHMFGDNQRLSQTIGALEGALQRVPAWPLEGADWDMLGNGMGRMYKRGRSAMVSAYRNSAPVGDHSGAGGDDKEGAIDENFHEWRKRVKDLWYHVLILRPVWPGVMEKFADEAHQLSDYLGLDHDLAVLRQTLVEDAGQSDAATAQSLGEVVKARRAQLQLAARAQGQRLYAEKTSAYISRLESYWRAWRE